eukprot:TRINITY_DN3614_c0_g1_i1.p1 TRINITY_DN3614_c0_g1~~TRINITY_DN3614_c0_g1_i1.p1  ORF type:complete len:355 (-),score=81.92 TRINITY_DN3614_c0_g1_i1:71-1084(-)
MKSQGPQYDPTSGRRSGGLGYRPDAEPNRTDLIAEHYNSRPNTNIEERMESRVYHMKNFNNWVKSVLINSYVNRNDSVLDLGGGKGGDLKKWQHVKIGHLVLADVAEHSVRPAVDRYNSNNSNFPAVFVVADCWKKGWLDHIPREILFDVVSCQFSFHYAFETEEKARNALYNITCRLKPGGTFIGTIPNAYWIVKKIRSTPDLSFGNEIFCISFEQKDFFPPFGAEYLFQLEDSVDCPEFLVHMGVLQNLAAEYDLKLEYSAPFHNFFKDSLESRENVELLYRMKALNQESTISADEWEACGIYSVFVFKKNGTKQGGFPYGRPQKVSQEDIIFVR